MATIRAAVCHRFGEPLAVEQVELAPPGPGEIEVAIRACAVCHSDIHYAEGAWGGELPAVYGHEAAGVIGAVGPGVAGLAAGDHVVVTLIRSCGNCRSCISGLAVFCETEFGSDSPISLGGRPVHQAMRTGAFAERVVVHASQAVAVPADLGFDVASLLACGVLTGFGAVATTSTVTDEASVVVVGTGGVGLNAVQGARLAAADPVIAVDLADPKLDAAKRFGATHLANPAAVDAVAMVREATGGRGASHVFVTVGSKAAIESGFGYLRRGGELVVVGMPPYGMLVEFEPATLASEGWRIVGSKMGSAMIQRDIPHLIELYRAGDLKLDELITGRYSLDQINEAIESVNAGEALRNVIVFP